MEDYQRVSPVVTRQRVINHSGRGFVSGRERLAFRTQIVGGISHRSEGRITKRRLPEGEGAYDVP